MLLMYPAVMLAAVLQFLGPAIGLTLSYWIPLWVLGMITGMLIFGKSASRGEARHARISALA